MVVGGPGNQNVTRLADGLQAGGDVDTLAIEITALDDDVAEIAADAQYDALCFRPVVVRRRHLILQLDRARHGIDSTRELYEHAVAHKLDDAAVMLGHQRLNDARPPLLQGAQSARLVRLHEATVADHVGGKYGGQAALDAFSGHAMGALGKCSEKTVLMPVFESIALRIGVNSTEA